MAEAVPQPARDAPDGARGNDAGSRRLRVAREHAASAKAHYLKVTDAHFTAAAKVEEKATQNPTQQPAAEGRNGPHVGARHNKNRSVYRAMRHVAKTCKLRDGLYRSRTDTPLRAQDFESSASANSAKRPCSGQCIIGLLRRNLPRRRLTAAGVVALLACTHAAVLATFASTSAGPSGPQPVVRTIVGTLPR